MKINVHMTRWLAAAAALGAALLAPPAPASADRGYSSRPCGFDLNRNGVIGEAADCRVCDGTTADPDGDGVAEDLLYIDCQAGTDSPTCGSPASPCRTIAHAWNSRADGPGDGAEDILCFRGVCHEESIPTGVNGVGGTYTVPRTGSQARSWQLPSNPTMLVGWDSDGDHVYPPHDTGDVAMLDGTGVGFDYAVAVRNSRVEIAHFSARNYGRDGNTDDSGFSTWGLPYQPMSHIYFHDLSLVDVNRERIGSSGRVTLSMWAPKVSHLAYVNLKILNTSGFLSRGTGPTDGVNSSGPIRYQRLTVTADACDEGDCPFIDSYLIGFKLWDWVEGVEVIDSVFDGQLSGPNPAWVPGYATGVLPAQCSRDWVIRNNEFVDMRIALHVQGYSSGACNEPPLVRTVSGIVFDRNLVRGSYDWDVWSADSAIRITDVGPHPNATAEDVKITNNMFHFTGGSQGLLLYQGGRNGAAMTAPITIVGNTFSGDIDRQDFAGLYLTQDSGASNLHQNWDVRNNIFVGLGPGDLAVSTQFAPGGWTSNYNVFDADADFGWNGGSQTTLGAWRAASGGDAGSRECAPSFVGGGDLHLAASDTCALGAGGNTGSVTPVDFDGDPRPQGAWEIGADEVDAGTVNTPPSVTIGSPAGGSVFPEGTLIAFAGSAGDLEDGDLTADLVWTSSLDGTIGTGGTFPVVLSVGSHQVTASVTDSGELTGDDSIAVTVLDAGSLIFADGFETGDVSVWSTAVPLRSTMPNDR